MKITKLTKIMGSVMVGALVVIGFWARAAQWQAAGINVAAALATVASNSTSGPTNAGTPFLVPQNVGMTIEALFTAAGVGTSNVIFSFNATADGTNWTTTLPLSFTNSCNGSNVAVVGWNYFTALQLDPWQKIRLDQISTTQTNAVTITAVTAGYYY